VWINYAQSLGYILITYGRKKPIFWYTPKNHCIICKMAILHCHLLSGFKHSDPLRAGHAGHGERHPFRAHGHSGRSAERQRVQRLPCHHAQRAARLCARGHGAHEHVPQFVQQGAPLSGHAALLPVARPLHGQRGAALAAPRSMPTAHGGRWVRPYILCSTKKASVSQMYFFQWVLNKLLHV